MNFKNHLLKLDVFLWLTVNLGYVTEALDNTSDRTNTFITGLE